MSCFTFLGDGGLIWVVIAVVLLFTPYWAASLLTFLSVGLCCLLVNIVVKKMVKRPRPFQSLPQVKAKIKEPADYSFPSGHSACSFAAAASLCHVSWVLAVCFFAVASCIAFSRLYLLVHYPSDALGGVVIGLICAEMSFHLLAF